MAKRQIELLTCDLHGDDTEGVETISFGLDGSNYEIDVCKKHAKEVRDAFGPYVGAARRATGRSTRGRGRRGGRVAGATTADVRAWAIESGYDIGERGRIPAMVVEAYKAAH